MKVDESNYSTLEKASKITMTDYNIRWFDAENINGYIDTDDLLDMIDNLIWRVDELEEKIEDMEQDIKDNYKLIEKSEQYDIHDNMFV